MSGISILIELSQLVRSVFFTLIEHSANDFTDVIKFLTIFRIIYDYTLISCILNIDDSAFLDAI